MDDAAPIFARPLQTLLDLGGMVTGSLRVPGASRPEEVGAQTSRRRHRARISERIRRGLAHERELKLAAKNADVHVGQGIRRDGGNSEDASSEGDESTPSDEARRGMSPRDALVEDRGETIRGSANLGRSPVGLRGERVVRVAAELREDAEVAELMISPERLHVGVPDVRIRTSLHEVQSRNLSWWFEKLTYGSASGH